MSKLLHFHFQENIFGCFSNNFIRFFSIINNNFFQFEDFQLQIFQAFIFSILFWEKYFSEYFFQNNFCQISAPNFSDFWRIKIQNFQPNFLGDCTQRERYFCRRGKIGQKVLLKPPRTKIFSVFQTYNFIGKRKNFLWLNITKLSIMTSAPLTEILCWTKPSVALPLV